MGARSLTVFVDGDVELCVLYRQFDGFPSGHGVELAEFLAGMVLVDGIPVGDTRRIANGMSCLAAQVVAHLKKEVGGFYLYPAGTRDTGEEFVYVVSGVAGDEPRISCAAVRGGYTAPRSLQPLFEADATEFLAWAKGAADE